MKIALMARNPNLYSHQRLIEAAEQRAARRRTGPVAEKKQEEDAGAPAWVMSRLLYSALAKPLPLKARLTDALSLQWNPRTLPQKRNPMTSSQKLSIAPM